MRPESVTPDLLLDGVGYRLEHVTELEVWLLLRPYRGIPFPALAQTRARLAHTVSLAPRRTRRPSVSAQLRFGWHVGRQQEDTPCHTV